MLPSAYQIRTGIRKFPWLLTQGVRDGGTKGEILNQGSAPCCFSPAATIPHSIAEPFPLTQSHTRVQTPGGNRSQECVHWSQTLMEI